MKKNVNPNTVEQNKIKLQNKLTKRKKLQKYNNYVYYIRIATAHFLRAN